MTTAPASPTSPPAPAPQAAAEPTLRERVVEAIKKVYDPEIPVNIYELGLIYDVAIDTTQHVDVRMTLTSPACPSAQELPLAVRSSVERIPGVNGCDVQIVFDPPWTPQMMSVVAKITLGMG